MSLLSRRNVLWAGGAMALGGLSYWAFRASQEGEPALGPWLAPARLAERLHEVAQGKLAVLYVGPRALFARGHVPGARNVGEAGTEEGRAALRREPAALPAGEGVVLYCGCCPVRSCPNVRPASALLAASGRADAHVLDLPTRFATDWAEHGYPVEKS